MKQAAGNMTSLETGPVDRNEDPGAGKKSLESEPFPKTRACLLILGMHRSGTSAVCGVLHQLGAERPVREMPPQPDNEKGFFEPIEISAIHDRMLASAGLYWFDWEPMPRSWYASAAYEPFRDELAEAAKYDFPGRGPFLLKDPRICRFVDVWLDALARIEAHPVVVFQYRHPAEVAQSLKTRDGFSIAHGLLMWLRHIVDAEKASRATERSFINFSNLLVDWQDELGQALENGSVRLPKKSARAIANAGAFLDETMRHHVKKVSQSDHTLHDWFTKSFDALEQLRADPYDLKAMAALDAVRVQFDAASAAFSPAFQQLLLQVDHLGRAAARVAEVDAALALSRQTLAVMTPAAERLPLVVAELEETRQALAAIQPVAERVPSLEAQLAGTRQALETAQPAADRIPDLEAELEGMNQARAALQPLAERVPSLEAELEGARQALAEMQPAAELVPSLEAELESARHALADTGTRVSSLEEDLRDARQELARVQAVANRVPSLDAELADVRQQLTAAQPAVDRLPGLEVEHAAALRDLAELHTQLETATQKLKRTIGGRLVAASKFARGQGG